MHVIRGQKQQLHREAEDKTIHFTSGLKRIDRTYFCAEDYLARAREILIEGYSPPELPGFNLFPKPVEIKSAPGIYDFSCSFYGAEPVATRKPVKKSTTIKTTVTLVGKYENTVFFAERTFAVLAEVLTFYYALPAAQQIPRQTPPVATLENFNFVDENISITAGVIRCVETDPDSLPTPLLKSRAWLSIGTLKPRFVIEDVTTAEFGEWKESTVSWRAEIWQKVILGSLG